MERRTRGRPPHPDFGESTRERAERLKQPVRLREVEEPDDALAGTAVPVYTGI